MASLNDIETKIQSIIDKLSIKTITGVLPLTFTAKAGNAAGWVIEGNDEPGTVNLFDFQQFANGEQTATYGGLTFSRDGDTIVVNKTSNVNYPLVFLNSNTGVDIPSLIVGQTYSGKIFLQNAPQNANVYVDIVGKNTGEDWTWITSISELGVSFTLSTAYEIYGFRLVCNGLGITYNNVEIKLTFVSGSTAPDHYIPYQQGVGEQRVDGYYVPLTISQQGQPDKTYDIYIGDSPLTEGETVSKASTGVDIELFEGENTVSTILYNNPKIKIYYKWR